MLLRRISKHVKDQNWFAVFLDFFIVVAGILIAFQITNWNEARKNEAAYQRAMVDIREDVGAVYEFAKERVALAACRQYRYKEIGTMLMEDEGDWTGISPQSKNERRNSAFPEVFRSPQRPWVSILWETELSKGTFNLMENNQRQVLSTIFHGVNCPSSYKMRQI